MWGVIEKLVSNLVIKFHRTNSNSYAVEHVSEQSLSIMACTYRLESIVNRPHITVCYSVMSNHSDAGTLAVQLVDSDPRLSMSIHSESSYPHPATDGCLL